MENNVQDMVKMMNMMQLFQEQAQKNNNTEKYISGEDEIYSHELRTLKTAMAFMGQENQSNMGLFIKLLEMQALMEFYQKKMVDIQKHAEKTGEDWRKEMLKVMSVHFSKDVQEKISFMIKIMDMNEMI